jgi:hypothetical protein
LFRSGMAYPFSLRPPSHYLPFNMEQNQNVQRWKFKVQSSTLDVGRSPLPSCLPYITCPK